MGSGEWGVGSGEHRTGAPPPIMNGTNTPLPPLPPHPTPNSPHPTPNSPHPYF
ncbi:MAG: hypothetical protein DSM106950_34230 [Stigonema ocellatum SAG 48.90 = DSM 106950]|nr:hypothetical protein [Stigonema ocellatum SAG 48.90 = DSM 106950]